MASNDGIVLSSNLILPAYTQAALGLHPDVTVIDKFGSNPDIDTASDPEDIWGGGGVYTGFPTQLETITLVSSSTADDIASTGAQKVTVYGLDGSWDFVTEEFSMTGQTDVDSTSTWRRVNRVIVSQAGSGRTNAGAITVNHTTTTANVFSVMTAGDGQSLIACYTTPRLKTGILSRYYLSVGEAAGSGTVVHAHLGMRNDLTANNTAWRVRHELYTAGHVEHDFNIPILCVGPCDIRIRADVVTANNSQVTAGFEMLEIPTAWYA